MDPKGKYYIRPPSTYFTELFDRTQGTVMEQVKYLESVFPRGIGKADISVANSLLEMLAHVIQ